MGAPITQLLWLDTETTGLDPGHAEVMQIGALLTDLEGHPVNTRASIEIRQRLRYPERMHPGASKRHGVASGEEWNARPDVVIDGIPRFRHWLDRQTCDQRALLAGWNPGFDERMLRQNPGFDGHSIDLIRHSGMDYHMLDVWSLAFLLLGPAAASLESCAKLLGLEPPPHSALADAELSRQVWLALRQRVPVPETMPARPDAPQLAEGEWPVADGEYDRIQRVRIVTLGTGAGMRRLDVLSETIHPELRGA